MTKNNAYPHLLKDPKTDFRQLVIDMFAEYLPQLTVDVVLMGTKRIFIKL
jgi:hypothetical protein